MINDDGRGPGEQILHRARTVAVGLADVGLTQAEEVLRRLSPEGRAQARREREARARRHKRLSVRVACAAIASLLVWVALASVAAPAVATVAAAAMLLLLTTLIVSGAGPRTPGREALMGAALPELTAEATIWLAAQRRGLPRPAAQLADMLTRRLDELAPQLARIDPRDPAADAFRKLVATELPSLVEGWRAVPVSLRGAAQANGCTPDRELTDGLRLIDAEVARMTEQLAHGTLHEVSTQKRYLELKYRGW